MKTIPSKLVTHFPIRFTKSSKVGIIAALLALLASTSQVCAVVGQFLQVHGTNLILSWPSLGYEQYMIQYRQTLEPTNPWTVLTNNYFANSTNFTTFVITGAIPPPSTNGTGGGGGGGGVPPPDTIGNGPMSTELMVAPADGSWQPVPFIIFPPGMDTNGLVFFEAETPQSANPSLPSDQDNGFSSDTSPRPQPPGGTNDSQDPPACGFYRVWHIPNFLPSVQGYVFDGPYFLPVDFKDYVDKVVDIEVLLNGEQTPYSEFTYITNSSGDTNWGVGIYFDQIPNGTYQIQLATTLLLGDDIEATNAYLDLTNSAETIIVKNQVTYTNWNQLILSSNYTFNAQTLNPTTQWEIDINDASGNYVNSGFGRATAGQVAWTWNLYDSSGNLRDDPDADPFFQGFITFNKSSSAGGGQTTRRTPSPAAQYPSVGNWLISYCDRFYLDGGPKYSSGNSSYITAINTISGGPALKQDPFSQFAIKFGTNYAQTDRNLSWLQLKSTLYQPEYRNFYYYGHGGATSIGADEHKFDSSSNIIGSVLFTNSQAYLTSKWVRDNVTFNQYGGIHRYRFVFLDGCSTANGDWPDAFGIGKTGYESTSWYLSTNNTKHVRPCAFVGWNQKVGGPGWGTAQGMFQWLSSWMGDWAVQPGEGLHQAFTDANSASGWIPQAQLDGALVISGYRNMLIEDYNHKGDWSWP